MAKRRLSRSKANVRRRAQRKAASVRNNSREKTNNNPLERATRLARRYENAHLEEDEDIRDRIKVFYVPDNPKHSKARYSVRSWKKFMREEKYRDAVSEILLSGDFVLGVEDENGDLEDEIETLIEGI